MIDAKFVGSSRGKANKKRWENLSTLSTNEPWVLARPIPFNFHGSFHAFSRFSNILKICTLSELIVNFKVSPPQGSTTTSAMPFIDSPGNFCNAALYPDAALSKQIVDSSWKSNDHCDAFEFTTNIFDMPPMSPQSLNFSPVIPYFPEISVVKPSQVSPLPPFQNGNTRSQNCVTESSQNGTKRPSSPSTSPVMRKLPDTSDDNHVYSYQRNHSNRQALIFADNHSSVLQSQVRSISSGIDFQRNICSSPGGYFNHHQESSREIIQPGNYRPNYSNMEIY